jgi:cytidylate kinase
MAVITLSRQIGSGGDEIAARVCELLGYRYFDKQLMVAVAADVGLREDEIVDFSEERYKVQDFLSRLLHSGPRPIKQLLVREETHRIIDALTVRQLDEMGCGSLVRYSVQRVYEQGNTVIVGRGGQAILKDRPGVLHVRVIAPPSRRIERLRAQGIVGVADIKATISQQDRATAEYLKRFFNIDWNDPSHYHLILNTGLLDINAAAQIIAAAVEQIKPVAVA